MSRASSDDHHPMLIVRRGDLERLRQLEERFADGPVEVIADRRSRDRRLQPGGLPLERRRTGRRTRWTAKFPNSAFIVVPPEMAAKWVAPAQGDVLVMWTGSGGAEPYELSVAPGPVQARYDSYDLAVERARRFARFARVDLWYTEDRHTFVLLELCRPARSRTVSGP